MNSNDVIAFKRGYNILAKAMDAEPVQVSGIWDEEAEQAFQSFRSVAAQYGNPSNPGNDPLEITEEDVVRQELKKMRKLQ